MSTKRPLVLVLVCSTRPGALGPEVGDWLTGTIAPRARELGVDLMPVAIGDLGLPFLDEEEHPSTGIQRHPHTRRWSATVAAADGFVVVTPEYNYGMPATLKNALDYLGAEWAWKPVGFVSYGHTSAGTRAVQHAKQVVTTLRLVPLGATVAIRIADATRAGHFRPGAAAARAATGVLDELVRVAQALRPMREYAAASAAAATGAASRVGVGAAAGAGTGAGAAAVAGTSAGGARAGTDVVIGAGPGPGPLPGSYVRPLTPDDAPEVTVLQRCCWVEEAVANDTLDVPALHEPLDAVRAWLGTWHGTGLFLDGRLLAMVRTLRDGADWRIGRLAVAPDARGRGLGRWMLRAAESAAEGCDRATLTTGSASHRNLALYTSEGYRRLLPAPDGTTSLIKPLTDPLPTRTPA